MARLTAKQRKAEPKSDFGIPSKAPGHGSYPMPDKEHARVAKSYASKEEHEGKLSKAEEKKIDAKADSKLHTHVKEHKRTVSKKVVTVKAHKRKKHGKKK